MYLRARRVEAPGPLHVVGDVSNPAPDVLADLLVLASEAGPERLVETDRLLRDLVGPDVVNAAHAEWTGRLRDGVYGPAAAAPGPGPGAPAASADVFDLTRRLRATTPGRRR